MRLNEDPGHFDGKPSIAVLPFENFSADPEQCYLADGIVEDIVTQLARNKDLKVIARMANGTRTERVDGTGAVSRSRVHP